MGQLSILSKITLIGLIIFAFSCGINDGDSNEPDTSPAPTVAPSLTPENPISSGEIFGTGGNLWKPISDTSGNMVVVFDKKFVKKFSKGCRAFLKNGKTDELFCNDTTHKCFGNGDRLHMRGNQKCEKYAEVKVICEEEKQSVTFTAPPGQLKNVCRRFG